MAVTKLKWCCLGRQRGDSDGNVRALVAAHPWGISVERTAALEGWWQQRGVRWWQWDSGDEKN